MPGPSFQTRLLACLTLLALILTATPAAADTWIVRPDESIQAAIDQAASGDTILILPGQYQENLLVQDKQLTVLGVSPDLTTLQLVPTLVPGDSCFVVRGQAASGTTISGLKIRPAPMFGVALGLGSTVVIDTCVFEQTGPAAPLHVSAGVSVEVRGSRFTHLGRGIQNDGHLRLLDCQFGNCNEVVGTTGGFSLCATDSTVRVEQCVFTDCTSLIQADAETVSFEDSLFYRCRYLLGTRITCPSVQMRRCSVLDAQSGHLLRTHSQLTITDTLFAGNQATLLEVYGGDLLTVTDCTFIDNSAQRLIVAAQVADTSIRDCLFQDNSYGIPVYIVSSPGSTEVIGCTFVENTFTLGVAITAAQGAVAHCRFEGNRLTGGPAIMLGQSGTVSHCSFIGNTGGVLLDCPRAFDVNLINSTIVGNNGDFNRARMTGCTFIHNTGPCLIRPSTGSIIRNNVSPLGEPCGVRTASYSNTQGFVSGPGNIDADPLFIRNPHPGPDNTWGTPDDDYGDLRLQPGSPCIDAADSTAFPEDITTDLAGNPRFTDDPNSPDTGLPDTANQRAVADMGAYEYQPGAPHPLPCDHNADDTVDQVDLLLYLNLWFHAAPPADLNTDGAVDVFDLLAFLDCFFAND